MSVSRERLRDLAAATGFRPETLEKVIRLGEVLAEISRHPFLGHVLALKGGTALNLGFGPPARLSVDLDLNYVGSVEREAMLRDRPEVERAVERIAAGRGYRVQRSRDDHAGRKLFLGFQNSFGTPDRVEVDLNFLFRLPLGEVRPLRLWQPGDIEWPQAPVVPAEELAAGKLCALVDRVAPRDLFDAAHLPSQLPAVWESARFRRLFVVLAGTLDHPLDSYGRDRFDRVTDVVVREQLHPMLIGGNEPTAAALRDGAWAVVEPLLRLDEAEREYTERLQAGELRPDLLFPEEPDFADRLGRHPALLWKAQNARERAAQKTKARHPRPKT